MTTLNMHSENDVEVIGTMVFKSTDVLVTEREKITRNAGLLKATVLDSLSEFQVVLVLEDMNSQKKLRSRIIATGNDRVMLEKGLTIPLFCIRSVEFPS